MRHRLLLMTVGMLFSVLAAQGARVTFFATDLPEGVGEMKAYNGRAQIQSGAVVSMGARITFVAEEAQGYVVDWFVDGERLATAGENTLTKVVTKNITVEARYHVPYKVIFAGTPFFKYADKRNIVTLGANFYHHRAPTGQYGATVEGWTTESGTKYLVDNNPNDTAMTRIKLEADSVLIPVYVANDDDLGDACGVATWSFAHADSTLLFDHFKGQCVYVAPTDLKAAFVDVAMAIDATEGFIDNSEWLGTGTTRVDTGTRFRLPSLYGTIITIVGTQEFTATTIDGKAPVKSMQDGLYTASLSIEDAIKDSVDIVIGENQYLVAISANYPGGYTQMTWQPNIGEASDVITTVGKSANGGTIVSNQSDIMVNGLKVVPSKNDTLTSMIEMTAWKLPNRHVAVNFEIADGFSLQVDSVIVPIYPVAAGKNGRVELLIEDEQGNRLDSVFTTVTSDSLCHFAMVGPQNSAIDQPTAVYLYGKVTVKCWVYGQAACYRLGSPMKVTGTLCETITCGEGKTWASYVTKGGLNLEKLTGLSVWKVTAANEKREADGTVRPYVTTEQMEEVRKGHVVLINTQQPGAVYNSPLSRADDAATENNLLQVSDGAVTGNGMVYTFAQKNGKYGFWRVPNGEQVAEGEVYMEWNSWTSPECFYLSEADIPTGISGIEAQRRLAKGRTYRMAKNGRIFVVKPDGSVFTLDGVRVL